MSSGTVRLHRVLAAPPERVWRAFTDAAALAKWLPPHGFTCHVYDIDAQTGGMFRMQFTNFANGQSHAFGGQYLELQPPEYLRYIERFDDPGLPGEMETTITLMELSCGTELNIVQVGIPELIPEEMCYLGWQASLDQLRLLVETVPAG